MKKFKHQTKTFLGDWLEKSVKQYVVAMKDYDNGQLHELILNGVERPLIEMVLRETAGNQTQASNILGINRNTLRKKIKEYDLR
jgi:DNA-binding protein Fis